MVRATVHATVQAAGRCLVLAIALGAGSCSDDVGLPDARPPTDAAPPGQLMLTWSIANMGTPLTCAQIAGSSVTVTMVPVGALAGVVDSFSCTSLMGVTRQLPAGDYDVEVSLEGSGGTLGGPVARMGVTVPASGTGVVDPVAFEVDPHGDLTFNVTSPGGDNCGAMPGGAGITAIRVELRDSAGTCVPTTFMIGATAYASDCATATTACFGASETVTAADIDSGQRSMLITGLVGTDACWHRTTNFVARAAGFTTTLNPQQLIRDTTVCPAN
ncbi:MAG: hypothetical protein K8M05_40330 [Deltaproteobacteria bacterium]|nr:hypothetical protein [Kofleriaceae bacterium]